MPDYGDWGFFGFEPPCEHLVALRQFLESSGLGIWGEDSLHPDGWVNVLCSHCHRTYEVTLREPFDPE